jgi:hypothetical protein
MPRTIEWKASFEYLFPRMPEGALYLIEDWAWSHWPEFQTPNHSWACETPFTRLVFDLVVRYRGTRPIHK